jgi:hypothetical protein
MSLKENDIYNESIAEGIEERSQHVYCCKINLSRKTLEWLQDHNRHLTLEEAIDIDEALEAMRLNDWIKNH